MARILSRSERDALAELVAKVESTTAGELVTVVLKRSASYGAFRLGWAVGVAVLGAAAVHLGLPHLPAMELLGAEALIFLTVFALLAWSPLFRRLVPRKAKHEATSERARLLFLSLGVSETRDRSGVLILMSEFERRVEILGDRGIYQHLGKQAWEALVSELVISIRGGRAADGLRSVIEKLGRELAAKFPPRPDDFNELPNHVITDDD